MDVLRPVELTRIGEISIMQNARLIHKSDLNPIYSKENLRVQFEITGDLRGNLTCYLCLDHHELTIAEKNYYFPLFIESMNILVGRQISLDDELNSYKMKLYPPKISMNPCEINTNLISQIQKYNLVLESVTFCVLVAYSLQAIN